MDIWLIFVLFIPFVEVTIHAIIEHSRAKNERRENVLKMHFIYKFKQPLNEAALRSRKSLSEKLLHFGVPMIFLLFSLAFFEAGFILLWKKYP